MLHATEASPGASNDKTLFLDDEYHNDLQTNTLYSDYKYDLLDASSNTVETKGVYTICDGGFTNLPFNGYFLKLTRRRDESRAPFSP